MKTVLIADDSMTSRMIIRRCLEMIGFKGVKFLEAKDGKEALEMVRKEHTDLIIADLNMPNVDGESLVQSLKASPETKSVPILIASSAANPVRRDRLTSLGAIGMISKPVSPGALKEALAEVVMSFAPEGA